MSNGAEFEHSSNWLASCSFVRVFRTFRLAVHPTKLGLALMALMLTWAWGSILDAIWVSADRGVPANALQMHLAGARDTGAADSSAGQEGVFEVWKSHSAWCLESALCSVRHGTIWGLPTSAGLGFADLGGSNAVAPVGLIPCVVLLFQGAWWFMSQHALFALLFFIVALAIWALFGGAICRIAAVQFARDEKIGFIDALKFAKDRFWAGLFLAPILPVLMLLVIAVLLALGGVFLRIPYLGDVVGSLVFLLAILGGFGAALVVIGTIAGGSLFWPTVAVEGSESLDAVSRSFNYVGATPWRTLFYALVATVYGSLCFLFVRVTASLTLIVTHACVGFGTSPFGWWKVGDGQMSKLDLLWQAPSLDQLRTSVEFPGGVESFAAGVIGIWILLLAALVWSFLASFYLSGSTVIYFLLRRDNDAMDLEDVYIESYQEGEFAPSGRPPAPEPGPAAEAGSPTTADSDATAPDSSESGGQGDDKSDSSQ
jgi:hypothetical protein